MICTDDEIRQITRRARPSSQIKALRFMGIEHRVRPDGSVLLLRSHVEHLLSGGKGTTVKSREPNWSALNAKVKTP